MKYIDEFRRNDLARQLADAIRSEVDPKRQYNLMEFCGGHTHAIFRYGVQDLMPQNVKFVHGPGCPVCVLPVGRIDQAISLIQQHDVILCTYGDLLRVPASGRKSLMKVKAEGADVRMVYSTQDALKIAREHPDRQVVFFAIGFETTTPPTAVALKQAQSEGLENFSVFCNHVLTPAAIQNILESPEVREMGAVSIDGFFGPSHVSSIIGSRPYEFFAEEFRRPVVIAGFEPLDVMQSALMLIRQLNEGRHEVENEYTRVVSREGNLKAQRLVGEVMELRRSFEWRGLGEVPYSALKIKKPYAGFDAERRFPDSRGPGFRRKGLRVPAHTARREKTNRLQIIRHGLYTGKPYGLLHGVVRGRMCRLLELWSLSPARCGEGGGGMTGNPKRFALRLNTRDGTVDMTHGSGGRAMAQLIDEIFLQQFDNELLRQANDQAAFDVPAGRMVMSVDGHVISPLFFPGGDIGSLSVHGTINDVAMSGAKPLYLSAGFILEEGFPLADLQRIAENMANAAKKRRRAHRYR